MKKVNKYFYADLFAYVKWEEIPQKHKYPFAEYIRKNKKSIPLALAHNYEIEEDEKEMFYGTFYHYDWVVFLRETEK
jgi:hypothetical protein